MHFFFRFEGGGCEEYTLLAEALSIALQVENNISHSSIIGKFIYLMREFCVKLHAKTDIARIPKR